MCPPEIVLTLVVQFSQSYKNSKLLKSWLLANITLLFKKGDLSFQTPANVFNINSKGAIIQWIILTTVNIAFDHLTPVKYNYYAM